MPQTIETSEPLTGNEVHTYLMRGLDPVMGSRDREMMRRYLYLVQHGKAYTGKAGPHRELANWEQWLLVRDREFCKLRSEIRQTNIVPLRRGLILEALEHVEYGELRGRITLPWAGRPINSSHLVP